MHLRTVLAVTSVLVPPTLCAAQPVSGLYVGAGAGANFMQDESVGVSSRTSAYTIPGFSVRGFTAPPYTIPASSFSAHYKQSYDPGATFVGSVGYGLGNGLRLEIEGDYRFNHQFRSTSSDERKFGGLANALFDLDVGSPFVFPYAGLGAGYMWADRGYHDGRTNSFAYQAIAGLGFPIGWVPGLTATLEYRFLGLAGASTSESFPATRNYGASSGKTKFSDDFNHSILVGVRYAFNTLLPPPPPAPAAPVAAVSVARTYLVFFDWDRSDLTDRARQIIAEAARASTRTQTTRIDVQGNADRSGTPAYNQALSLRRAQAVAAELVRLGVARTAIDIEAFGDTRPLVPTAAGVREPQNRRVAIILR